MGGWTIVVYPYASVTTNPTIMALIGEVVRRGFGVHLLAPRQADADHAVLSRFGAYLRCEQIVPWLAFQARGRVTPLGVARAFRAGGAAQAFATRSRKLSNCLGVIGVDPLGISIAARLMRGKSCPLSYISFEILFADEAETEVEQELKSRERSAAARCDLFLLQDEGRRDVFCKENQVAPAACELVPVAPVGPPPRRTDYLHRRLELGAGTTILLHQGSLADWSGRDEIEELATYLPEDVCLVVHSRHEPGLRMRKYMRRLEGRAVRFTTAPVPPDELAVLTASADIGWASYRLTPENWTTGDNLLHVGLSSGKIGSYAMAGVPVLARYLPSVDAALQTGGFGYSYRRLEEVPGLVKRIRSERAALSEAARRFYEDRLNPSRAIRHYCDRLFGVADGPREAEPGLSATARRHSSAY